MVEKRFEKLGIPDIERFENYLPTAFNSELTLLQKVNKIIFDLIEANKLSNEMVDYLNKFIEKFDEKLYKTLDDVLKVWLDDGILSDIVRLAISEEVIEARGGSQSLGERLDSEKAESLEKANEFKMGIGDLVISKVDKGGNEQVSLGMLSQEVKEIIAGSNSLPIVAENSVNTSNIVDGAVTRRKIAKKEIGMRETRYLMAEGVPSKNIFPGWERGGYDFITGAINDADKIRTAELIPVTEGEYIWINDPESQSNLASNCQVLFEFDVNKNFLKYENINVFKERGYLPKANCHYVGIMSQGNGLGGFVIGDYKNYKTQIEHNVKFTGYETPWPKAQLANQTGLIIVDKESNTNKTISSAVDNANDTLSNPLTIEINPTTYKESVFVGGGRNLSIVGKNKKDCVIKTTTGLYLDAPLEIGGNGYVSNLTLIADYDVFPTDLTGNKAYALHVDYAGEGVLEFFNCHFKSSVSSALGLGTHNNQKIIFRNCTFEADTVSSIEVSKYGAAFLHASTVKTAENQHVEFHNCRFKSANQNVLWLADVNGSSTIEIGFYNCMLWSDVAHNADSIVKIFGSKVIIKEDSFGNNVALLNKS